MHSLRKIVPWLLADSCVVAISIFLAMVVRSVTAEVVVRRSLVFGIMAVAVYCVANYAFSLYHRMWRYASAGELVSIGASVAVGTLLLLLLDFFIPSQNVVPFSVVAMTGVFAFGGFIGVRYRRRVWTGIHWRLRALGGRFPMARTRVLLVGAGEAGQLLAWRLQHSKEGEAYDVVGFVDDDPTKHGMRVHGIPVRGGRQDIPELVETHAVELVVIAMFNVSGSDIGSVLDICERTSAVIKVLPDIFGEIAGKNGVFPLRNITSQDLIGRKSRDIDPIACRDLLKDRTVLVTGAAGTIGSELCHQIAGFGPRQLVMLDNNESGLYELEVSVGADDLEDAVAVLGDVTNEGKMRVVFEQYRPQIIFHAAAYKHVPLVEAHPDEGVRVNILGTRTIAELANLFHAERFVLISTDKAVDPSSVMGSTKRLCEIMIGNGLVGTTVREPRDTATIRRGGTNERGTLYGQALSRIESDSIKNTLFTAVRFGNVLGSRGSVVPTFEWQIDRGGPVTVTHPDMTRYFMSTVEAVSLTIEAATLTEGNDIFMLDMGQQIQIDELARRLIRLRGLRPGLDIPITYTGVRPGEKMQERLMAESEERFATRHPHIFRIRCNEERSLSVTPSQIDQLITLAENQRNEDLLSMLRKMVGT